MSLKLGNELSAKGFYREAIAEYKRINPESPLYQYAKFNVCHIKKILEKKKDGIFEKPRNFERNQLPLLSIVMPVFNVAPYLDTSIVSVLSQRYQNFELIIINDASTDNGRCIIEMHVQQDSRIRFINLDYNTLGGAGIPSNIGIRAARGKYIAFVDSDDWVTANAFMNLMEQALKYDADVAIGSFCTFTEDERVVMPAYDGAAWAKVPKNTLISIKQCPELLRLSPVPWRKIYKRDFLLRNGIEYPEGDYFFEDNPLHWFVLSKAERVIVTEDLVGYHRMAREGQTMSSATYKLSAITCHINTILNFINTMQGSLRRTVFEEFYDYCYRSDWIVQKQTQFAAQELIKKRWAGIVKKAKDKFPLANVRDTFSERIVNYSAAYPDIDLTIVIPVFNSADLIRESLDSILKIDDLKFNVLAIDDGSTDDSLKILQEYEAKYPNIHVFVQSNKGAGRARNVAIPMCTGIYTYFLDADDVINADSIVKAVKQAKNNDNDLLFFKYRIEYYDEKKYRGMFNADEKLWEKLSSLKSNAELQKIFVQLINYPWNRIIKTDLLHNANIFFGSTIVHNDISYHWHSVIVARQIGYINDTVCSHRKFNKRGQVTNISDARRMAVLEALRSTHEAIVRYPLTKNVLSEWNQFSSNLLKWAEERISVELREEYKVKRYELIDSMDQSWQFYLREKEIYSSCTII